MYKNHKIAVVVPAYNEQELILETLGGMPELIDEIFVVEDGSSDGTRAAIEQQAQSVIRASDRSYTKSTRDLANR